MSIFKPVARNERAERLLKSPYCLFRAVEEDDLDLFKTLVEKGADVNMTCRNIFNDGILYKLSGRTTANVIEMARILLEHGADPNTANIQGNTPLIRASFHNSIKLCELLVEYGADVNRRNLRGETALSASRRTNSFEVFQFIKTYDYKMRPAVTYAPLPIIVSS
jgi:uncharacterized protein